MKKLLLPTLFIISVICKGQDNLNYSLLNLDSIYQGNKGAFVLYDYHKDSYKIYNYETAKTEYSVQSTSKIFWSIIGLEENLVKSENDVVKWDSLKYPRQNLLDKGWAKDQTIITALNKSVNWYYFELLALMTPEMVDKYLNSLDYKKGFMVERVHYFGLSYNIRKSAIAQIDFLKRLYNNDLKISNKTLEIVKKGLVYQKTASYTLYIKTGHGPTDEENKVGWVIGFVEKGNDVYFFALNVIDKDIDKVGKLRIDYSMRILKSLGMI